MCARFGAVKAPLVRAPAPIQGGTDWSWEEAASQREQRELEGGEIWDWREENKEVDFVGGKN